MSGANSSSTFLLYNHGDAPSSAEFCNINVRTIVPYCITGIDFCLRECGTNHFESSFVEILVICGLLTAWAYKLSVGVCISGDSYTGCGNIGRQSGQLQPQCFCHTAERQRRVGASRKILLTLINITLSKVTTCFFEGVNKYYCSMSVIWHRSF